MEKQWQYLKRLAEAGKLPHAFLFSGNSKDAAQDFIKLIHCQNELFSAKPCGSCRSCKDIEKQMHPDFVFIKSQDGEIKISQIRELKSYFSLKPSLSNIKTALIDEAHLMNREAQSSFLKLLEEPRGNSLFILATQYPEMLLPTILSRVEKVRFFSKVKPEQDFYKKAVEDFLKVSKSDLSCRFQYVKELSSSPELKNFLESWIYYLREALLSGNHSAKLIKVIKTIQRLHFLLTTTNVNPRLALETLMLEL